MLNGEDTLTVSGSDSSINQKLLVYGRPVVQKDVKKIIRTDDRSMRIRGEIETEYQSKWIQNEAAATALANWLATHWTDSDSELTVEIFGNPLIELTDVVTVQHQSLVAGTDKYYVTGIQTSFQAGINTTLTLRKVT